MKTIAVFSRYIEADVARTRLESAGISVFFPDEATTSWMVDGACPLATGIRLQVAPEDEGRAREVLAEPPGADAGDVEPILG